MSKTEVKILIISIGLATTISTLFGFAGSSIIGSFWGWFWLSLLIQFIVFAIFNSFLIKKDETVLQQTELEMLDIISKFTIKLSCSYCQQTNSLPIQLNRKNTFKCEGCNQVNGVSMQFMATTITTPIESVKIPVENSSSAEFRVV